MSYGNWYYKWNDGSYKPYDNNVTQWLNNANVGEDTIMIIYGNKYKITRISPQDCTQKNLKSGGQRRGINQQKYNQLHNQNNNNNNNNYQSHNQRNNNNYHKSQNINQNNNCQQQWYWQDNNGSFKRFQNNISSEINKLQIGQCYMLNIGQSQYEIRKISNTKCVQRNIRTNFSRNVFSKPANNTNKYTPQKQHNLNSHSPQNNSNKYKWFWKDNNGNLKQYPHNIAVEIEALKINDVHFTFANETQYEIKKISKHKCIQNNLRTNFSRDVIRQPAYNNSANQYNKDKTSNQRGRGTHNYEKADEKQKFDKWYWINDKGDPKCIDDWLCKKLNNLQIGQTMRQRIHGSTYEFQKTNSDKGQQKNMKTGKTRVITTRKVNTNTRGKSQAKTKGVSDGLNLRIGGLNLKNDSDTDNEDQYYNVNIKPRKKRCERCDGTGTILYSECSECDGTGYEHDDVYNINNYGINIEQLNNSYCKQKKPKIEKYDDEQDYYDSKNNNVSDDEDVNDKCVSNPVIINIGISQYEYITNLPGVKPDVKNWNNLWYNVYGFKKIYDNQNEPGLTHDGFWEICLRARKRLCSETHRHDGLIFSFSGHGDIDTLCMSDCNPKTNKGLIKINDVINYFSGHNVKPRILKCPRILILDKCRGEFDSDKDLVADKTRGTSRAAGGKIHPMENVRVLYANTSGYTTADTKRGGYLTSSFTDVFSKANGKTDFDKLIIKVKQRVSKISKAGNCVEDKNMMLFNFYLKPKGGYSYGSRGIGKLQKSGTTASK